MQYNKKQDHNSLTGASGEVIKRQNSVGNISELREGIGSSTGKAMLSPGLKLSASLLLP